MKRPYVNPDSKHASEMLAEHRRKPLFSIKDALILEAMATNPDKERVELCKWFKMNLQHTLAKTQWHYRWRLRDPDHVSKSYVWERRNLLTKLGYGSNPIGKIYLRCGYCGFNKGQLTATDCIEHLVECSPDSVRGLLQ